MMNRLTRHSGLWLLAVLCLLSAVAVVCVHFWIPVQINVQPASLSVMTAASKPAKATTPPTPQSTLPTLASFTPAWDLRLRPVQEAPPPAPTPTVTAPPPPPPAKSFTAKLTGTIIEPNHSMALFTTQTGEVQFVNLGQMVEDAKVVQIQPDQVIIERNGQTLTLEVDDKSTNSRHPAPRTRPNVYQRRRPLR